MVALSAPVTVRLRAPLMSLFASTTIALLAETVPLVIPCTFATSAALAAADVADDAAAVALLAAAVADDALAVALVAASPAFVLAVLADAAASSAFVLLVDADDALAVALLAAAVALLAAAVALVVALAASTISAHFALSVLVVSGCDPDDVCAVTAIKILFVDVSLTRSRTA